MNKPLRKNKPDVAPLPPGYHLTHASIRDLTALQRLEKICFPKDAWPLPDLIGVLLWPDVVRYKVVYEGRMVGFGAGQPIDGAGWIVTMAVHPEHRRRGLGWALLMACEHDLPHRVLRLAVRASNRGAQALYRAAGYEVVDRWPRYYVDREDALIMEKVRSEPKT